jgi:pimeloyl-ACP methyl ester carboxylesterase
MTIPLYEFGGSGPPLILNVGNGFPPETYRRLVEPLTADYRVVCVLPRPLWPEPPPPESLDSWRIMADDLRTAVHQHGLQGAISMGHSMGGVATIYAQRAEPGLFRALALLDPTIMPPEFLFLVRALQAMGMVEQFPPVKVARRRRDHFESTEAAFEHWRGKSVFANWPPASLRAYAEGLTTPAPEGGVTLAWSKAWEAQYYATLETHTWQDVRDIAGTVPALFVQGEETDAYMTRSYEKMQRIWPGATHRQIAGHGHLFPISAAEQTAAIVQGWLGTL